MLISLPRIYGASITVSLKSGLGYPDTYPIRYHFSNLRHTILQRNLIHNHFRQRGEHRER